MKTEFSGQIFDRYSNISNFMKNPLEWSPIVPRGKMDGRTDITKLIFAFRNFANASKARQGAVPGSSRTY